MSNTADSDSHRSLTEEQTGEQVSDDPLEWYQLTSEKVASRLGTNLEKGLTEKEAALRLTKNGKNVLTEGKKESKLVRFFKQFNNSIIYILLVAGSITLWMGHISDSIVIGVVVLVNALIGYIQENKAEDAINKIKQMLVVETTVIRDGQRQETMAEDLVLGDLVFLEAGDSVPADLRIIDEDNLKIQEAALTGEAYSVEKITDALNGETVLGDQKNMAFASTAVTNGSCTGIVVATNDHTEIGKINESLQNVKPEKTPLTKSINQLGKWMSYVIVVVAVLLFIFGFVMKIYPVPDLLLAVITMVVGSIPEGLPAITAVIMAIGVQTMAKKHAIVKNLPSVETLGSVNIITTDKTGTLTKNEMTVTEIVTPQGHYQVSGDGYKPLGTIKNAEGKVMEVGEDEALERLVLIGREANDSFLEEEDGVWSVNGEPTDGCFLTLAGKAAFPLPEAEEVDKIPFDSDLKYMAKIISIPHEGHFAVVKGAPDRLFEMLSVQNPQFSLKKWGAEVEKLAAKGDRVVALAFKKIEKSITDLSHEMLLDDLVFVGIAGIVDPPKEETIPAIKAARKAGVKIKMITGDHPATAVAIAEKIGLSDHNRVITGQEIDELSSEKLKEVIQNYDVFARSTPDNKLKIVQAFQENDLVTAMTGDGVNDAPALKQADIGVAMGIKGTDVAKEAANMVLADDNFATIVDAIREGRRVYDNIKKTIQFLLPTSIAEGLIVLVSILLGTELPLDPVQLLWINMVSAITISFAFVYEPGEAGSMSRAPRKKGESILKGKDMGRILYVAMLIAGCGLMISQWLTSQGLDHAVVSTVTLNVVVFGKIFYLFNVRTKDFALSKNFFTNKVAFFVVGLLLILQFGITYLPFMQEIFHTAGLSGNLWLLPVISGLIIFTIVELEKLISKKLLEKSFHVEKKVKQNARN